MLEALLRVVWRNFECFITHPWSVLLPETQIVSEPPRSSGVMPWPGRRSRPSRTARSAQSAL